jgi:antitoxin component YwqK of YwqJK toxin-antitoxin module
MRYSKSAYIAILVTLIFWGAKFYTDSDVISIDSIDKGLVVLKDSLTLNANKGLVYYGDKPFTGVSESFYFNGIQADYISYQKGKQHGKRYKWFPSGVMSEECNFAEGRRQGKSTSWWSNGKKRSEANFQSGVVHGLQKQWYASGNIFKELQLKNGLEDGIQKAWRENGKLYTNYEARNGRIFGLKRANLCYQLDEEEVQYR